jgi:putative membrane protein insertion efficiency factor
MVLIAGIHGYRWTLGPFLGGHCRYSPSCSTYGLEAVREWGPFRGFWMTAKRIARCHPWAAGGFDPVPSRSQTNGQSPTTRH